MNTITKFRHRLTIATVMLLAMLSVSENAKAQADRSLYFLPIVPHLRNANPAHIPDYRFYVGIPLLSSVKTGFENTFVYNDIVQQRNDSLYLDRDYLIGNLKDKNTANLNLMEEYLSLGFGFGDHFVHFRVADIARANATITKDLIRFMLYGNGSDMYLGQTADFGGNAVNLSYYREYAAGYSQRIDEKFNAGINLKYLQGIANFYTENLAVALHTDSIDFTLTLQSDIRMNMSSPGLGDEEVSTGDFLPNSKNSGFAFDVGVQYRPSDKIAVSANLLDIGSIMWNSNVKNYRTVDPAKTFTYQGIDFDEFIENDALNSDRVNEILDSIAEEIGIDEHAESYRTRLPVTLNLHGSYLFTENDQLGLLVRSQFLEEQNWWTSTLGYTRKFGSNVNLMISNSFFRDSYFNPGIGFAANIGPVQLYLINENFHAPFTLTSARTMTVRFGINLVFKHRDHTAQQPAPAHQVTK